MEWNRYICSACALERDFKEGMVMSFDIVNCRRCGRLMQRTSSKRLCPQCEKALEDKFQEVREYIRDNPNVTIMEVSRELDVSVEQIKQWVREERLLFSKAEGSGIQCMSCGVPIATGKYCARCKAEMSHSLENAYDKPKVTLATQQPSTSSKGKMRFLGVDEKK